MIDGELYFENIIHKDHIDKGILGEANDDGTINIDSSVKPGSAKEKEVIGIAFFLNDSICCL